MYSSSKSNYYYDNINSIIQIDKDERKINKEKIAKLKYIIQNYSLYGVQSTLLELNKTEESSI